MRRGQIGWYASRDGQQFGPFSQAKLDELVSSGQLTSSDLLWQAGWPHWVPVAEVLGHSSTTRPAAKTRQQHWVVPSLAVAAIGLLGALGGGLLSNWQYFFPPPAIASVEQCDKSLGDAKPDGQYSGVYSGVVWDGDSEIEVQLKLVRNENTIQGSYFRHGVCGTIYADIIDGKMHFIWHWAGGSGRGIASQEGTRLVAVSGFGEATDGAGTLVFYEHGSNTP